MPEPDEFLTPAQVAERLKVTVGTLKVWRTTKRYPLAYVKRGRNVLYLASDVEAFAAGLPRHEQVQPDRRRF
jgi:hypothetical protein